jgi:methyl-accepting chemotaxis protein
MNVRLRWSYKAKILATLLSVTGFIFISILVFYFFNFQKVVYNDATRMVNANVRENANQIAGEFNTDIGVCRSLANVIASAESYHSSERWPEYVDQLKMIDRRSEGYLNVWASFELSSFRKGYTKDHGRRVLNVYTSKQQQHINDYFKNLEGDDIGSSYHKIKLSKQEAVIEPYLFSLTGNKEDEQLVTSICVPILNNSNKYIGLAGIDIGLDRYKKLTEAIKPYAESYAFMIAYDGTVITHPDTSIINQSFIYAYPGIEEAYNLIAQFQAGDPVSFRHSSEQGDYYYSFAPIVIGDTETPWTLATVTPARVIFSESRAILWQTIILGLLGALVFSVVTWLIVNRLTRNFKQFTLFANRVNEGELTASLDIERNDEVGMLADALRRMAASLREIVNQLKISSANISEASELLNTNSQSISYSASKQAAEVEEISSALEQMVTFIDQNAQNSKTTEEIALLSKELVNQSSVASNKASKSILEITSKNKLISDIAFQTNILSLNAAVEAARAGDAGRGFSVVASEVRKLAERSKIAAEEIAKLSDVMVNDSGQAEQSLNSVLPEIAKTTNLVQDISVSSKEQAEGVRQINMSIRELNDITQDNASSAENLAASAEELSAQAQQLEELIGAFKS